jgi:uncharacterized damage-inducible protein DinB
MQTFFRDFINILQACHNEIMEVLAGLPSEALDWTPGPDMNSLSVIVTHLTGAERYWIGDVAAQEPSGRDRDAEFKVYGLDMAFLEKRLGDNLEYARNVVSRFSLEDLAATRKARDGESVTVAWALLHALEHSALHQGQIELTRQLWEQARQSG